MAPWAIPAPEFILWGVSPSPRFLHAIKIPVMNLVNVVSSLRERRRGGGGGGRVRVRGLLHLE